MRGISTFGAFTTARLGIYAAQKGLDVTGHNITNINTYGYTRQRLDQMAFRTGGAERYASSYDSYVGNGVICTGVSQLRDPYLDIRFRNEQSSVGSANAKLAGLDELSSILDEVAKGTGDDKDNGIILAKLNNLLSQLQDLSKSPSDAGTDSRVQSAADALVNILNRYSEKLDTVKENQDVNFRQDLGDVNDILKQIGDLNNSIFNSEMHGDSALEMRDDRNLLIDQLSSYMKINISYESVSIGAGKSIDKMIIKLAGEDKSILVDGNNYRQFSLTQYPKDNPNYDNTDPNSLPYLMPDGTPTNDPTQAAQVEKNYDLTLSSLANSKGTVMPGTNPPVNLSDTALYGALQSSREILTEAGEFSTAGAVANDPKATTKRGIPYYQKSLDAFANKLAKLMNDSNTGYVTDSQGNYMDKNGLPMTYVDSGGITQPLTKNTILTPALEQQLKNDGQAYGGVLFSKSSNGDDSTGITAANISISKSWSTKAIHIANSKVVGSQNGKPDSGANDGILDLIMLFQEKQNFNPKDTSPDADSSIDFYKGSLADMLLNMTGILSNDVNSTSTLLNTYASSAQEIDLNRNSISGVDLNDEATNMMQYQKSYSAACRLMTVIDETLDKLINSTGIVGR